MFVVTIRGRKKTCPNDMLHVPYRCLIKILRYMCVLNREITGFDTFSLSLVMPTLTKRNAAFEM